MKIKKMKPLISTTSFESVLLFILSQMYYVIISIIDFLL